MLLIVNVSVSAAWLPLWLAAGACHNRHITCSAESVSFGGFGNKDSQTLHVALRSCAPKHAQHLCSLAGGMHAGNSGMSMAWYSMVAQNECMTQHDIADYV